MAPTLYEYDSFGNLTKQTLALEEEANSSNSAITEFAYTLESSDEGVFTCYTQTRYNAENLPLTSTQKQLISQLSATLAEKVITINERGLTSADWTVYNNGTKRSRYNTVPTSNITAETVTADGLTVITCRTGHHALRHITWESPRKIGEGLDKRRSSFAPQGRAVNEVPASHPTQPVATRPLAIRKDGTWFAYGWDLTKNICEIFGQHGYLRTAYTYSPYGEVTADGDVTQPVQWSSEYNDTELALVYYNYRHYNPADGRWIGRDRLGEKVEHHLYAMLNNHPTDGTDQLGNVPVVAVPVGVVVVAVAIAIGGSVIALNMARASSGSFARSVSRRCRRTPDDWYERCKLLATTKYNACMNFAITERAASACGKLRQRLLEGCKNGHWPQEL